MIRRLHAALAILFLCIFAGRVQAKDHYLVIGGGYSPEGNQLSIEENVLFFQEALEIIGPERPSCDVFFADGEDDSPDVQYYDEQIASLCTPARKMLAEIFSDQFAYKTRYRNHAVRDVAGPTDAKELVRTFRRLGRQLQAGDRLIVFVDAHGAEVQPDYDYDYERHEWVEETEEGAEIPYNKFDTHLLLWNEESISASEFNNWLNYIDRDATVVLVMGQCYAGGFSHAIFHGNNAELGLSPHARCGFFAQVPDRPAAGCTPNNEIEEYSYLFWSAIAGRTRGGEPVTGADYDNSGKVSLAEAHAYATLTSATGDVPVSTSGALLRHYSTLGDLPDKEARQDAPEKTPLQALFGAIGSANAAAQGPQFRRAAGPIADLEKGARPEQVALIRGLSEQLELEPGATIESLRIKLRQLKFARGAAEANAGVAAATVNRIQEEVQGELRRRWPELTNAYSPVFAELAAERSIELVEYVGKLTAYEALQRAREKHEALQDEAMAAEAELARAERLLQVLEEIVLAHNLPQAAPAEIVDRHQQIVDMESQPLG